MSLIKCRGGTWSDLNLDSDIHPCAMYTPFSLYNVQITGGGGWSWGVGGYLAGWPGSSSHRLCWMSSSTTF